MRNLFQIGFLLVLTLPAFGQGTVRRADTLLQVLSINPTNLAVADKLMYLTAGRNAATDGEVLFVDWDKTNALATNATSRFVTTAGIGRWVVRPILSATNTLQFLAGSNMTVSVTLTSVTYSSTGGSSTDTKGIATAFDGAVTYILTNKHLTGSGSIYSPDLQWHIVDTNLYATVEHVDLLDLPTQAPNYILGSTHDAGSFSPGLVLIGANLDLTAGVLSALVSSGTNTWSIEVGGVLVLEPNLVDTSTVDVSVSGSDVSFDVKANSITTNMVTSDIRTLLFTDATGAGTNLIVNGALRQPAIITNSASVTWTINGDGHIVATAASGSGESTTASNLDTQSATNQGWFKSLSGSDLQFRNFAVGPNLTLRSNANSITLDVVLSTNSGTVVSIDGGSSLTIANFADAATTGLFDRTGTNVTFRLPDRDFGSVTVSGSGASINLDSGSVSSNNIVAGQITQDKLSATGTSTSTNFLAGDWTYKQVTTNMIPGLVAALQSLQSALTFTNGVTNLSGVVHGNYAPGTSITFTTNAGRVTIASTATGGSGSGTNLFVNNILSQPAKITNSTTVIWTTNSNGDIVATATNVAGTTTDNMVQLVGYARFTITNNSTVGDFSYESLGGIITDINCSQCDNDRVGKIDFTFTTLATNYFWTITREGSSAVGTPIGSHTWEDTGLRTTTSLRLFMMDDGGSITFSDITGYMFRFNLYSTATVGGNGGSGDPGIQVANSVYSGPTNGSPATPTFRALVAADIPSEIARLSSPAFTTSATIGGTNILDYAATHLTEAEASALYQRTNVNLTTAANLTGGTSTNFLAGDGTFKQVSTNHIPGLNAVLATIGGGSGEVNTGSNLGTPSSTIQGLYNSKSGVDLRFRSIEAGSGITLTSNANTVAIASTGGTWDGTPIASGTITNLTTETINSRPYFNTANGDWWAEGGYRGIIANTFLPMLGGSAVASGSVGALYSPTNNPFVVGLWSSTTTNSGYYYHNGHASTHDIGGGNEEFTAIISLSATNKVQGSWGFIDTFTQDESVDGVYFRMDNGYIQGVIANNSSYTRTATSNLTAIATDTYLRYVLRTSADASYVTFWILAPSGTGYTTNWTDSVTNTLPKGSSRLTAIGVNVINRDTPSLIELIRLDAVGKRSLRVYPR